MWLKLKEEASGWPSHIGDDPVKCLRHLPDYEAREGIQLDLSKIQKNPGLCKAAKMMLNSMWGKFREQTNKTQIVEFHNRQKFSMFHESNKFDISYVSVFTKEHIELHYKREVEDNPVNLNFNIFVACFTTCWARLRLYEVLDLFQGRVVYFDTDSVVFRGLPGQPNQSLGVYLGDFKDELPDGDHIVEFASRGPKNYGYLASRGREECKVRKISLNSEGIKQLNYQVVWQNVLEDIQQHWESVVRQTDVVKPHHIVRNTKEYALETMPQTKKYQMVCGRCGLQNPAHVPRVKLGFFEIQLLWLLSKIDKTFCVALWTSNQNKPIQMQKGQHF